jgi:hypothetical protein
MGSTEAIVPCIPFTHMERIPMTAHTVLKGRATGTVLTLGIVSLAATTSYVHLTLGGLLFLLNGLGYAGLIVLVVLGAIAPHPLIARFDWFPRLALIGYTAMTIAGYLVIGPYFALGWITKGVELALIALVVLDVIRVYGSPWAMARQAIASVIGHHGLRQISPLGGDSLVKPPSVPADAREGL